MDRVNLNLVLGEEDVGCSVNRSCNLKEGSVEDGEATLEERSECVQGNSQRHIGLRSG